MLRIAGSVLFTLGGSDCCMRTSASMIREDKVLNFYAFGWGPRMIRRYTNGAQLVWECVGGRVHRMDQIFTLPEDHGTSRP